MGHVQPRHLRIVVAVGLVVSAGACGGSSDDADSAPEAAPAEEVAEVDEEAGGATAVTGSSAPTPIVVGDAIVDLHGPDAGVAATLYALETGYSVAQLAAAALEGTLGVDGSIAGITAAEGEQGVIAAPVNGIRRSTDGPERTAEEVQREIDRKLATLMTIQLLGAPLGVDDDISYEDVFPSEPELDPDTKDAAAATIGVMVALVDVGYSLDQVVNGFIFGETAAAIGIDRSGEENPLSFFVDGAPVSPCIMLRDSTGQVILPDGQGSNILLSSTTCGRAIRAGTISFDGIDRLRRGDDADPDADAAVEPAADSFPRTYRADVGTHFLTGFAYDVPYECTTTGPMELTLAADGTATFTYFNGVGVVATLSDDGTPQISCEPRPGNTWTGTYDPELQTFEILPPAPEGIASWDFQGTFDAETAHAFGLYSLPPNPAGQQQIVEIEATLTM